MTTQTISQSSQTAGPIEFQTPKVLVVALAHFVHDTYPAFLAPLIPLLTDKLGLSLALAGSLVLFMRTSALVQPFIGYLADRTELQYFVIVAPALTAISMSLLGVAPSYVMLIPLLVFTGLSTAMFHAPAPAMITRVSGQEWGKGLSVFMAGGELGRSVGPLFIVAVVDRLGLENAYVAAIPGLVASLILYRMMGAMSSHLDTQPLSVRAALSAQRGPLLLLLGITLFRGMSVFSFLTFLPTYLTQTGTSLFLAGAAVSAFELAGVGGALLGGTLSDRLGRRTVFLLSYTLIVPVLYAFLHSSGAMAFTLLLMAGFVALSTGPVALTVVQELFKDNRSTATGLYISFSMLTSGISTTLFGALADAVGLPAAMNMIVFVPLLGVPLALLLPETRGRSRG
ncbi:MAG: Fosmidomycin resistance protein [Anaerolineales bacterium]|nr:Fosmidomycin resistance protein [Anaerolineales bacterium]